MVIEPKLRFNNFKNYWKSNIFNETLSVMRGGPFGSDLKSSDYLESGIRVIQLQNIGEGFFNDCSKIFTSIDKANELRNCNIFAGEIIISKMGDPVARACIIPDNNDRYLMCSDGIRVVTKKEEFDKTFIFLYINSYFFRKQALRMSTGSTRARIGLTDLKKIIVNYPEKEEQQKIASFLSSVDKKIELLTKKYELLEKYKKGLMQKIFSQEIRFKQDDGSDFPDWTIGILENLIKNISDGGTPPTNDKSNFGGEINWVVIDDIQDKIGTTKTKLTEKGYKKCSSSLWEPEDIILSTGATIGEVGITKVVTATKQGICGIKVSDECCNIFLKEWFKSEIAQRQFKKYAQGSSITEIRPPTLRKFKIIFPELDEQKKIATFLSSIDKKIDLTQQQIKKSQTFKKGLLQQMFV